MRSILCYQSYESKQSNEVMKWFHSHIVQAPGQFAVPSSSRCILHDWLIDIRNSLLVDGWGPTVWILLATRTFTKSFPFRKDSGIWTDGITDVSIWHRTDNFLHLYLFRMENGLSWMWTTEWGDRLDAKRTGRFFGEKARPFGGHSEAFFD